MKYSLYRAESPECHSQDEVHGCEFAVRDAAQVYSRLKQTVAA